MAAAIEAASGPTAAEVTLVEREDRLGGMVLYASGLTAVVEGSALERWDEQAGTENLARERYARDLRPEVIEWTEELGQRWVPAQTSSEEGVRLLVPEGRGPHLIEVMEKRLDALGVRVLRSTSVLSIERGRRFKARLSDGEELVARGLILATGGYMGNTEMVRERMELGQAPLLRGSPKRVDGNGFSLATALGAEERLPAVLELYAHGIPDARDPERAIMIMECNEAWPIDSLGRPFPAVRSSRGDSGRALLEQGGGAGWLIADDIGRTNVILRDPENTRSSRLSSAPVRPVAETRELAELASALQVPLEALERGLAAQGTEPTPERPLRPGRSYAAWAIQLTTAKGLTGIDTDLDGRALDAEGRPISGLFVAGELSAFGHPYDGVPLDSTMIAGAILTGRVAGRALVQDLK